MQSMPITTDVVSSSPVHGEVYSIQYYVIKFVSDLHQVIGGGGLSLGTLVSSTNKTDRHDSTEILLKVALKTFKPTKSTNHTDSSKPLVYISLYMLYLRKYKFSNNYCCTCMLYYFYLEVKYMYIHEA